MCIKIIYPNKEEKFNSNIPLEAQIANSKEILIDYDPKDTSVEIFLKEIERLIKHGVKADMKISVKHNNNISGAKFKKAMKNATKDLHINELISIMVKNHLDMDNKLVELSNMLGNK